VIFELPVSPSLLAVMVALPGPIPVTRPLELTVATAWLVLDQETGRSLRAVPLSDLGVALSC
jgi:hypothetical protein